MKPLKITLYAVTIFLMINLTSAHADGDVKKGKRIFKKCKVCHSLKKDAKAKIGPNLYGIIGRKIATSAGFKYSKAMLATDFIWTEEQLKIFITKPKKMFKRTKMIFPGLKKKKDRDNLIAYMKSTIK